MLLFHTLRSETIRLFRILPSLAIPTEENAGKRLLQLYLIALSPYLVMWSICNYVEQFDTMDYLLPAKGLIEHNTFGEPAPSGNWYPLARRTPGLPLVLAFFYFFTRNEGVTLALAALLNALVAPVLACTAYAIGNRLSRGTAIAAYFFLLFHANVHFMSLSVMTDLLFAVCFWIGIAFSVLAIRQGSASGACLAGSMIGLAALFRPTAKFYSVVLAAILGGVVRPKRLAARLALTCMIGFMLVVAPWLIRNTVRYGTPVFDTIQGAALLWSTQRLVAVSAADSPEIRRAKEHLIQNQEERAKAYFIFGEEYAYQNDLEVSRVLSRIAGEVFAQHPGKIFQLWIENVQSIWLGQFHYDALYQLMLTRPAYKALRSMGVQIIPSWDEKVYHLYLEVQRAIYLCYKYLAWVGIAAICIRDRKLALFAALTIGYMSGLTAIVSGYDRFRLVLEPLFAVFIVYPPIAAAQFIRLRIQQARLSGVEQL